MSTTKSVNFVLWTEQKLAACDCGLCFKNGAHPAVQGPTVPLLSPPSPDPRPGLLRSPTVQKLTFVWINLWYGILFFLALHDGEIQFLTLSRRAAVLCDRPRWLYDQKYALIALRVYFGPGSLAKNNTSQNKARAMWTRSNLRCLWRGFCLPLKCPVPKLQCCHNEVLPCNYPAVHCTQQLSRESAQNTVCVFVYSFSYKCEGHMSSLTVKYHDNQLVRTFYCFHYIKKLINQSNHYVSLSLKEGLDDIIGWNHWIISIISLLNYLTDISVVCVLCYMSMCKCV